jgi:hypothetical protein
MADAGTVTVTEKRTGTVKKITWVWVCDASGNADKQTVAPFDGKLIAFETIPAGGGSAPTDLYDITVVDDDGFDVLAGGGQNRATGSTQIVAETSLGAVGNEKLYLHVINAGNAKGGTVILWLR